MINELTKRSKKKALPLSVLLIVLGIIFAAAFGFQLIANTNTVIFDQLTPYEISDQRVEVNLTASFGCFLEQYTENSTTKKQTTDYLYYVIYTGDDFATDFRYMAIRVPVKFEAQMEKLTEETYSEDAAEALHFFQPRSRNTSGSSSWIPTGPPQSTTKAPFPMSSRPTQRTMSGAPFPSFC